jgi:hypothetical protein
MIDHDSSQETSVVLLIFRTIIAVVICSSLRKDFPNQFMSETIFTRINLHNAKDAIFLGKILRIYLLLLKVEQVGDFHDTF